MQSVNKAASIDLFNVIYSSHLPILSANISMSRWENLLLMGSVYSTLKI